MGLFTKKKEITEEKISHTSTSLSDLQDQLREYQTKIQEAKTKLDTVRSEYATTITNLMKIKKEINEKKEAKIMMEQQNTNLQMQIESGRKILRESYHDISLAEKTGQDLNQLKEDLQTKTSEYKEIQIQISISNDYLAASRNELKSLRNEIQKSAANVADIDRDIESKHHRISELNLEQNRLEQELINTKSSRNTLSTKLADVQKLLSDTIIDRDQLRERLESQKILVRDMESRFESSLTTPPSRPSDKNVIKAASTLVASYRAKISKIQKELDDTKLELEEERTKHSHSE